MSHFATGTVIKAFGNLLFIEFEGSIRQGGVVFVKLGELRLKGEVIEITGKAAKVQVFEDCSGVRVGTPAVFEEHLLEAELGPGLLGLIVDGLQNPLEKVADRAGLFLSRGVYIAPLDRERHWDFQPVAAVGAQVKRGDELGFVMEGRFHHKIMVPFAHAGEAKLIWVAKAGSYTVDTVIAKGIDEQGVEHTWTMVQRWPVKIPLQCGERRAPYQMMDTGERIIDTQFPVFRGGTFCAPGPFGAGKTVLQHHLAKYSAVDIVVIVACGERAGEVVEVLKTFPHLTDPHTSEPLMGRTAIICNTSSMPVASRETTIYIGVTVAEYYRQMGFHILLLADSTSRWAQAMREMSGRLEEIPGEEAFPAYLASRISAFYERSGVLKLASGEEGSLTIGGTVSPAGGNLEEPVTQATLPSVGVFHSLSRERSDARKYPAIDPLQSWSQYVALAGRELAAQDPQWGARVKQAAKILEEGDEIGKRMDVVGEEGIALSDMIIYLKAGLYELAYLQQNAFDKEDAYCPIPRQIPLFALIGEVFDAPFTFAGHQEAREFFLELQNDIKNMNFMPFKSERYEKTYARIQEKIASALKGVT